MKKNIIMALCLLVASALHLNAHDLKALRINEVMVDNTNSIVDEYGQNSAWVELFNANFAPLNINSIYIATDSVNKDNWYAVPVGTELTRMGKRQHLVFYLDGKPTRGPLHTNITLKPGVDNWIAIYDAGGNLIDSVTVPASLRVNESYARVTDGGDAFELRTEESDSLYVTPGSANRIVGENPRIKDFAKNDPNGFSMTAMAMCIVFGALLVLCLCFYIVGMIGKSSHRIKKAEAMGVAVNEVHKNDHDSGEEIAAISMALHEHFNQHDNESFMLTVKKMKRAYSPWSSKIYGLRETPQRRR